MKNRIDNSRQQTPWDNKMDKTTLQEFIETKYVENYRFKHPRLSETDEAKIINSVIIEKCKICDSSEIIKKGKTKNGIQMYLCKSCKKRFTPLKNTIFENHKISITEWIEFLLDIFNYGSTTLTSKVNKNTLNTSIYWLHKVFIILQNWQDDIILKGNIFLDEMFYSVIKSDIETKDGKKLRGLSHNQHCIGVGYDGSNIIAIVEGLGKTSTDLTWNTFNTHIKKGSKIIHDDEKAHRKLVKDLELEDENYSSHYLKKFTDKENPLRPINHQCDLIRQFLNTHSGFNREDLQNYLNLYCFMNSGHKKKLEKVEEFIQLAFNTNANLKYRALFESSDDE